MKVYLDGTEIFFDVANGLKICIGQDGSLCTNLRGRFKCRRSNKKDKLIGYKGVADEKGRKRKKRCDSRCVGDICRKVKQRCLKSCGEVGKGKCEFLKEYDDSKALAPSSVKIPIYAIIND